MLDKKEKNKIIRNECGVADVVFTRGRRKKWSNHVQRADEARLIRMARELTPHRKRDVGKAVIIICQLKRTLHKRSFS